jgi:hypothetical protein
MMLSRLHVSPAVAIAIAEWEPFALRPKSSTQDGADKGAFEPAIRSRAGER